MAAAKIDYDYHQQQINKLAKEDPSITVQRYCDEQGLKYGTAKRYLKSPKKSRATAKAEKAREVKAKKRRAGARDWDRLYEQYLKDSVINPTLNMTVFSEMHGLPNAQVRKNFLELRKSGNFVDLEDQASDALSQYKGEKEKQTAKNKSLNRRVKSVRQQNRGTAQKEDDSAQDATDQETGSNDHFAQSESGRDEFGRFTQGNRFAVVHGAYAQLAGLDDELVQVASELDPASVANELVTARAQYLSMLRFVAEERKAIIQQYEDGNPLTDFDDKVIPLNKALGELEFKTSNQRRALEATIGGLVGTSAKIMIDFTKLAHKEHELSPISASRAVVIRQRLMTDRNKYEWSALETAKRMEMLGVKPPRTLMLEAEKEIETYEPPVDDEGLSDEELEAQTQEYLAEQRQNILHDLPDRREKVADLLEMIGEDGQQIEGEGEPPAATSEEPQYDEDEDEKAVNFGDLSDFAPLTEDGE